MYFGMSVSPSYLEATVTTAAVDRERPDLEVLVNISQMTVSQMRLTAMTDSPQQRQQWFCEQVLNWSGLPVVNVRPTVFLQHPFFSEWAAESIARDSTIRLPFGTGRTSPIDAKDVAEVIAAILASPATHIGKVYELTGPRSQICMVSRRNIPRHSAGPSATLMRRLINGATKLCVHTICPSMCLNTS